MNSVLDPVIATLAAAVVGVTGPAAIPPPENAPAVCVHSSSTQPAAAAEAHELKAKIRRLVAELNTAAPPSDPRPARVTEMLERLDWEDGAHCGSMGKSAPELRPAGIAATIISALSVIGLMDAPPVSQEGGDEDEEQEDDEKDEGGDEDEEDQDKEEDNDEKDQKDDQDKDDEKDDEKKDPPAPPNDDPPVVGPGPAPDSPAAAVERLICDLANTLKASSDPAMRKLADDLLGILGGDRPESGAPDGRDGGGATSVLPSGAPEVFTDDFEGGDLGKWGTCQGAGVNGECAGLTVADGMGVGEDPERGMVAQFRVEDGNTAEMGGERSEVRDSGPGTSTKEGDDRWYSWSMKFPDDFPEPDGGWYIVMQWHQSSDSGSPPLALDISQGTIDIDGDGVDAPRETIGEIRRGEWVDYVMHVGFSQDDGFVEAWEDGVQTVQKTSRPTMTDDENYLKMGIYRDEGSTGDAEVWFDDFAIHDGAGADADSDRSNPQPRDPPNSDENDDGRDQDQKEDKQEEDSDPTGTLVTTTQPNPSSPPNRVHRRRPTPGRTRRLRRRDQPRW